MAVHPIKIHFSKDACDCKLRLLEGRGTWGVFSDNNFLTMEIDNPQIKVQLLEAHFPSPKEDGLTAMLLTFPLFSEAMAVSVSRHEIELGLASWPGENATFTLYFHTSDHIIFDAFLSRSSTQGTVSVISPDGKETDYLLPGQQKRRVTLPLTPPPDWCGCD